MTSFDQSLPMILNRTLDCVMPEFRELFGRYNLTEQQWRVLRVLWETGKINSADLSARTLLPSPSLVGIIDRLEKKGLVSRVRSVEDRRIVYVVATSEGRALEIEVAPSVDAIHQRIRQSVSDREWEALELTLEKISAYGNAENLKKSNKA